MGALDLQPCLWPFDGAVQALSLVERDNIVIPAVDNEYRGVEILQIMSSVIGVVCQEPGRNPEKQIIGQILQGGEGRFDDDRAAMVV